MYLMKRNWVMEEISVTTRGDVNNKYLKEQVFGFVYQFVQLIPFNFCFYDENRRKKRLNVLQTIGILITVQCE